MLILDAHVHCGAQDETAPQAYEQIAPLLDAADVQAAVCMPPVGEIYDRTSIEFEDNDYWRSRRAAARQYVCALKGRRHTVYPFYFVWNDFDTSRLGQCCGIKWHRHPDEPRYHYDDPACSRLIDAIRQRGLVVLIEEEFANTMRFVDELAVGVPVIVPHLGRLNGGFEAFLAEDFWRRPYAYTDMSGGCSAADCRRFLDRYGPEKLLFGSDYPFCTPLESRQTLLSLNLPEADQRLIFAENCLRLLKNVELYGSADPA
jgi:hypothetical protein